MSRSGLWTVSDSMYLNAEDVSRIVGIHVIILAEYCLYILQCALAYMTCRSW